MRSAAWIFMAAAAIGGGGGVDAAAVMRRDADFMEVRTKMTKDMSGRGGDPKEKYFHESVFHPHYDGRFAEKELGYVEKKRDLSNLLQTYLATFSDIGVETWIMHGSLLGWWWNRKILPWDSDIDVQVSEETMSFLATYYNMTVFHYRTPRIPFGRDYMLEINPHYKVRDQSDRLNVIDARWTDTDSGLFIDITTVRRNRTHPSGPGVLSCKDGHEFKEKDIFPLRDTFFEGQPAKVPFAYAEVLASEYGEKSLVETHFAEHVFDEVRREWVPIAPESEKEKAAREQAIAMQAQAQREKDRAEMEAALKAQVQKEKAEKAQIERARAAKEQFMMEQAAKKQSAVDQAATDQVLKAVPLRV